MSVLIAIVVIIFIILLIAAPIVYIEARKIFREQKNYERGLKMVPLLIHLPPPSDDTDVNGRDVRDVTDETISKAQIIYNIIASTSKAGFKQKFYGQRHFAFEIIGKQGFVYFYAAVPVSMVQVVEQAIVSAYPTARLEEVAEHNIFNQVGKINATLGGELTLKETFAYPIATYQDLKRDGMQSLLNSLDKLGKEDGVAIQFLLRPADPSWRKAANGFASKKRKGKDSQKGIEQVGWWLRHFITALAKPPENKEDSESSKKELSSLEQSTLDAIDDKTRHPGYETMIRLVVSSNVSQRSQALLSQIVASFSLYDAPGKNGFKYTPAKDIDNLVTSYIMRFFPVQSNKNILNSVELATLFHFPDQNNIPTSQLTRQDSKQVDGPRNMPDEGLLLGYNVFRGTKKPVRLSLQDRQRHMYIVGQTGVGKSVLLEDLALQDMLSGNGFAFVDPHGDTVERLLAMVPKERTEDLIYFSPSEMDYPMGLNLFEFHNEEQKDFIIQEVLNMLYKLYDPQHQGIMGPRYEDMFRNAALAVMADPNGGTFIEIPQLFRDPAFLKRKLTHVKDQTVLDFWQKQYPASQRSSDAGEVTAWFVSKFGAFLSNSMMRNIIGQTKSSFDLRELMDKKKILLVNLSKGRTGDLNSKLLGMIFVMKFQTAAMSRSDTPEDQRVDFSLYVDEFQNFSTDSFATIMSEARKYRLNLIVANQFTTQLTPEIRDAVFGNMGTIVSFRIGQNDVESLGKYFQPTFDGDDLLRVPNYNTIVRTLIGGVPTQPFSMATLPPLGKPNEKLAVALKQLSAAKYGKPRATIEKTIFDKIRITDEVTPSARPTSITPSPFAGSPTSARNPSTGAGVPVPAAAASFLDDWLEKRRKSPPITQPPSPAQAMPNMSMSSQPTSPSLSSPLQASGAGISAYPNTAPLPVVMTPTPQPQAPPSVQTVPSGQQVSLSSPRIEAAIPSQENIARSVQAGTTVSPGDENHNISSTETEQGEIDKIAAELRERLKHKDANDHVTYINHDAPTDGSMAGDDGPHEAGDTIYIDRDGTIHSTPPAEAHTDTTQLNA